MYLCTVWCMGYYYKDCIFMNRREMNFSPIWYFDTEHIDVIVWCPWCRIYNVTTRIAFFDEIHLVRRTRTNLKVYSQTSTVWCRIYEVTKNDCIFLNQREMNLVPFGTSLYLSMYDVHEVEHEILLQGLHFWWCTSCDKIFLYQVRVFWPTSTVALSEYKMLLRHQI
jgi:hypothetical protein